MQRGFSTRTLQEKSCGARTECFSTHFQDPSPVSQSATRTLKPADGPPIAPSALFRLAIAKHLLHLSCVEDSRQCQMSPPLNTMGAQCPHLDATGHTAHACLERERPHNTRSTFPTSRPTPLLCPNRRPTALPPFQFQFSNDFAARPWIDPNHQPSQLGRAIAKVSGWAILSFVPPPLPCPRPESAASAICPKNTGLDP